MEESLERAIHLREMGRVDEARLMLLRLVEASPDDARLNFELACICDTSKRRREALHFYKHAIEKGLTGLDLEEAHLGLAAAYCDVGEYDKSIEILRSGRKKFPENYTFSLFLAMALSAEEQHTESVQSLLKDVSTAISEGSGHP